MTSFSHEPVLVDEVIAALQIKPDGTYLDGTYGRGGHTRRILEKLGPGGRLVGMDRDQDAVDHAKATLGHDPRFIVVRACFSRLVQVLERVIGADKLDGALFDLGVSSPQLDQAKRGFSFLRDGPLDMRMDPDSAQSAADWLSNAGHDEIRKVLREYGEERHAARIAREIVSRRESVPITTTGQLAKLVAETVPRREPGKHPATRVFQAIRIHVNRELDELARMLPAVLESLKPGGRLAVISFHSLEDRIVKRFMKRAARGDDYPPDMPVTADMLNPVLRLAGKPVRAGAIEKESNPRARSAVLRIAEKAGPST